MVSGLACTPEGVQGGDVAAQQRFAGLRQAWRSSHALLAIPVVLILVITVVDIHSPPDVHLGPALVIAPAITASFAGPRLTGLIGTLALAAQAIIGVFHGGLATTNHMVQLVTITLLSVLVVFLSAVRERRSRQLAQVRSVAEAAQHVLLWPLPDRIGPLQVACLYLAAEAEAQIGGDLYAATRTAHGTRVMIGDVRGKGLPAIGEAALLLGAFREAAHQHTTLPALAAGLEQSVARYMADFEPEDEAGERFATTLLLEIPDEDPITRLTSCGHPPPLLLRPGEAVTVLVHPAPPLGSAALDRRTTPLMCSPSSPGTPSCCIPTASSKPATLPAGSTRSRNGQPSGPTPAPRPFCITSGAIFSPTPADASTTTPP